MWEYWYFSGLIWSLSHGNLWIPECVVCLLITKYIISCKREPEQCKASISRGFFVFHSQWIHDARKSPSHGCISNVRGKKKWNCFCCAINKLSYHITKYIILTSFLSFFFVVFYLLRLSILTAFYLCSYRATVMFWYDNIIFNIERSIIMNPLNINTHIHCSSLHILYRNNGNFIGFCSVCLRNQQN